MTLSLTDVSRAASERVRKCQEWLAFVQFLVFIYSGYMAPTSSILRTIARSDTAYLFCSTYPPRENSCERVTSRGVRSYFANFPFAKE